MKDLLQETMDRIASQIKEPTEDELLEQKRQEEAEQERQELKGWEYRGVTPRYYESTWENWIADTPDKKSALNAAKQAWKKNLLFTGNNGTGKTHLAMCLAKDGATYRRLSDIYREVRTDFQREIELLEFYGNRKLLIIDEIGRQKFSDFEINLFFDIIDRRWNNKLNTTIITNLSTQEFTEVYSTAVIDRLRPVVVRFEWESMRV